MATVETAGAVTEISNWNDMVRRHGQRDWPMLSHLGGGKTQMAELRESHLRYLLTIYELGQIKPDVGIQDIAKTLNCSKASVTKMMDILMDTGLLVRERYGKIYLTDTGFLLAKDLLQCVELIRERFPAIGLDLTEEETESFIRMMAMNLPEHCRKRLAGRT